MITISVPEMMCENCVRRITNALNGEGLTFTVSLEKKIVTLDGDEAKADKAIAALGDVGFDAVRA